MINVCHFLVVEFYVHNQRRNRVVEDYSLLPYTYRITNHTYCVNCVPDIGVDDFILLKIKNIENDEDEELFSSSIVSTYPPNLYTW